jgi:hypothetical protein
MFAFNGRAFSRVLSGIALMLLVAGCGSGNSQPQSTKVYVPPAPAAATTMPAPVTTNTVPTPDVQPVSDAPTNGPTITIAKAVWDNFEAYLAKVGRVGDGYYAVTEDGTGGASWACGEALCQGNFDGQGAAMQQCAAGNPGKTCVLFARDNHIQVKYQVSQ